MAKDTSLFDAMSENFDIKDDNGFITSIDGKEQDKAANKYWTFTINDEQVNVGAKDVTVADGDKIIFKLLSPDGDKIIFNLAGSSKWLKFNHN